jgi:hypothetical protein
VDSGEFFLVPVSEYKEGFSSTYPSIAHASQSRPHLCYKLVERFSQSNPAVSNQPSSVETLRRPSRRTEWEREDLVSNVQEPENCVQKLTRLPAMMLADEGKGGGKKTAVVRDHCNGNIVCPKPPHNDPPLFSLELHKWMDDSRPWLQRKKRLHISKKRRNHALLAWRDERRLGLCEVSFRTSL